MNIKSRLSYNFSFLVFLIIVSFAFAIHFLFSSYRKKEFYELLREKGVTITRLLYESKQQITPQTFQLIEEQDSVLLFREHISVFTQEKKLIYDSQNNAQPIPNTIWERIKSIPTGEVRKQINNTEYLYKFYQEGKEKILVVISAEDRFGLSQIQFLDTVLVVMCIASIAFILIAGRVFAARALRPITKVVAQVKRIKANNLHKRRVVAGKNNDEIAELSQTFNQMLDRIEASFVLQKAFVSNASHEMRTPLTIMRGRLEVTLSQNRSTQEYQETLLELLDTTKGMIVLVNDLLDLAQASSDISTLSFQVVRIDEVIMQAEHELLKKNPNYDVILDFTEVPEEDSLCELVINERLLKNAFLNLMENACKYSEEHIAYVSIHFQAHQIKIQVVDKGVGIAKQEIAKIFEPFYRSDQTRQISGYGIGLPLVKRIVDIHQGTIEVESQIGIGSNFTVTLPRGVLNPTI